MRVRTTIHVYTDLPDDAKARLVAYGVTDPAECIQVDMDVDSMAWFDDNQWEIVKVEEAPRV